MVYGVSMAWQRKSGAKIVRAAPHPFLVRSWHEFPALDFDNHDGKRDFKRGADSTLLVTD